MAKKKLKRRKSSILKNMNPDFVNKLSNIMGGAAKAQEAKNSKKSIGGRSNAEGKATPSKPKYPPLPPPLPIPIPKPTKINTKPETSVKPNITNQPPKPIEITKNENVKNDICEEIPVREVRNSDIVKNGGMVVENNRFINEHYFDTIRDIVQLGYENNKYFLEKSLEHIVDQSSRLQSNNVNMVHCSTKNDEKGSEKNDEPVFKIGFNELKCIAFGIVLSVALGYIL